MGPPYIFMDNLERRVLDWWKRNKEFQFICFYCGVAMITIKTTPVPDNLRTTDHILPKSQKGTNAKHNRIHCCRKCNQLKWAWSLEHFRRLLLGSPYSLFYGEKRYENRPTKKVVPQVERPNYGQIGI